MSSLKDLASLIMVPSLYKDGELHTVKPLADEDVILHPDATGNHDGNDGTTDRNAANFTFSRGSNLAATRVDVNGLIEKGRENLLLQSNNFNTTWVNYNSTETSGQSGYDGSNDAWLLNKTGLYGQVNLNPSTSGVQTYSVYAKAGSLNFLMLRYRTTSTQYHGTYFDLANGLVGTETSQIIDSQIQSVGNGWYRCSITFNQSLNLVYIYAVDSDGGIANGTTGNIYIQDAQLEAGLVATDYIETGASTAQAGILEDMPRLDYSGSCPALLLEPQRSNTFPNSEYLSGYAFARTNLTNNSATSPEGIDNAAKLYADTQTGAHYMRLNYTKTSDAVLSVFAKKGEETSFAIGNATGSQAVVFNLNDGTITSEAGGTGTIEDMGSGWYRCSYHRTAWADWQYISLRGNQTSYAGDGSSGIYLYGIQFEDGSYPTSYIPTYGSSVTRSVDSCAETSATDIINQEQGTLFVDFVFNGKQDNIDYYHFALIDSYAQNEIRLGGYNLALYGRVYSGGTLTFAQNYTAAATIGQRYKVIIKYGSEGVKTFANGQLKHSGTPTLPTGTMDEIRLTRSGVGTHSSINQSVYFPTALTDSECIALTTI